MEWSYNQKTYILKNQTILKSEQENIILQKYKNLVDKKNRRGINRAFCFTKIIYQTYDDNYKSLYIPMCDLDFPFHIFSLRFLRLRLYM